MGFDFTGHVLRAPRVAPGNSATSGDPTNGVVRDVRIPPGTRTAAQPVIADYAGDQYRAAVLQAPGTSPHEYLVWAAFSSHLALIDDSSWWSEEGTGRLPVGSLAVGTFSDGTLKVIVTDDGGRRVGLITHLVIARGDVAHSDGGWVDTQDPDLGRQGSNPYYVVKPDVAGQAGGVVTLNNYNVYEAPSTGLVASDLATLFDGSLSSDRGDRVVAVRYTLAAQKFWWTRNDRYETRFGWNNTFQRWMPYKGSGPVNLGALLFDTTYKLSPPFSNLPVGSVLPGSALVLDGYAMLRLGSSAGALSSPVGTSDPDGFTGVVVVSDVDAESAYPFEASRRSGIVGQTNGILQFNPAFVEKNAGKNLWYVYRGFSADADGYVGDIQDDLFISPVPGPTDHPFIRINNRTPLDVELVIDEAELALRAPAEGSCAVALTTGRVKLSSADVAKADSGNLGAFNKHFLGARIYYDGVALNAIPQPLKGPRPLVQSDGITMTLHPVEPMYLPDALPWPEDLAGSDEVFRGLGLSGVLHMPDGTGAIPDPEGVNPALVDDPIRPGGDSLPPIGGGIAPQSLGLIRQISDGVGDLILFAKGGSVTEVVVVDRISDLPTYPHSVPGGTGYISREPVPIGLKGGVLHSVVQLGSDSRKRFAGEVVYFLQASLNPSTYTEKASIASKSRLVFRFDGTEVLYFSIDGVAHDWPSSLLLAVLPDNEFFDAGEVATSIQARIVAQAGTGICRASGDRVVLEAVDPDSGLVEIGWGDPKDLTGTAALGFLPGWVAEAGKPNWLSDAGISVGLSRSLLNLDRSKPDADYIAQYRLEDVVLAESVQQSPFTFLDFAPVEDIAGYDEGVFFNLQTVASQGDELRIIDKRLGHYEEIEHRFPEGKFAWLGESLSSNAVTQRTTTINLGNPSVVPATLLNAPGINGAFLAAEDGGRFVVQQQGVDYLLPDQGLSGTIQLTTRYGASVASGGQGSYQNGGTTFTDAQGLFLITLKAGDRIKLSSGPAQGSYVITSVTDNTHCEVTPPFIADPDRATPWEAFSGYPDSVYDPAVVADQVYKPFNHLPDEPFQIRVLSPIGVVAGQDYTAGVEDANASGRSVSLRFGAVHSGTGVTAALYPIGLRSMGDVANDTLFLPYTVHVSEGVFSLWVGTEMFSPLAVAAFTVDPVGVEYLTADWMDGDGFLHPKGELKFNSTLLTDLASSDVLYVEELRDAANLLAGDAEYDPKTGHVRISAADAVTHAGKQLYFVEQMVPGSDVSVSPMVGAVSFRKPLTKGCLVEMEYWLATVEGRRVGGVDDTIIEFLPVFARRETTTRLTDHEFQIDPLGEHVIDTRVEPLVFVGPKQQNFGVEDFTTDQPGNLLGMRLTFNRDLPAWATPVATYSVFDALGGERAYTTSQSPVYRPPFYIPAGRDNFGLRGNRLADFEVGQMLRIGAECFYLTALTYFPDPDTTRVDIYPPTSSEVGSRSPGNDVLTLVTSSPITPVLDPDGLAPIATTAPAGFMQEVPTTAFPFEPVNAKQSSITFLGDLSTFAVPGHIMEIGGMPFTIAEATLSEDGTRTKITFTSPFRVAVTSQGTTVRLSYRPVYPPDTRQIVGIGPYVAAEGVELVLFGEVSRGVEQPGRTLAEGTEFQIDPETGVVLLTEPLQAPLGSGQKLLLSHTKIRVMEPFFSGGSVQFPRWFAKYKHNVLPSASNGYLGGTLTATYTFSSPDSLYYRALPLRSYLGEAVTQAVREMKQGQSSGGPRLTVPAGDDNWDKGNLGIPSERRDLLDKDRAARALLGFYNDSVVAFEQVLECIDGKFIGDRDGKFRFWIGRGQDYTPPGYEDAITGLLNPSNVWDLVFNEGDPTRDITFLEADPLVKPEVATISDFRLAGAPLGVSRLRKMMDHQKLLVRNDVDDILLLGASKPKLIPTNSTPYFTLESKGVFDRMGGAHRYSRLFPTSARVLFTLLPGIGADLTVGDVGVYSWGTINPETGEKESTYGTQIGQVANPVLGDITNVSESLIRLRLPRTRVFGYYPDGLLADALFSGSPAVTQPCCVVSMVPLSELPADPATGYPDVSRFMSQDVAGDIPDAEAGDPQMALPGFESGQKIGWGKPDGQFLAALFPEEYSLFGLKLYTSVLVDEVLHGCVLTFKNRLGVAITNPNDLLVGTTANTGTPAHLFPIERADTIYVLPPDAANPISDPTTQSPTMEVMQQAALMMPTLRQGVDITVDTSGRVIDLSLPSWADPFLFPIKEITGQKSPIPMSHLEGSVDFANIDQLPLNTPALLGQPFDDAGDLQIPYMDGTNTELDRFDEITNVLGPLMAADPVAGGYYPDEILFTDGEVLAAAVALGGFYQEPATLMTQTKTDPAATYGVAPGQEGDLLLVQVDPGAPLGWQGILSVGRLTNANVGGDDWSWIEPPRFATQVSQGSPVQYVLDNYYVHTTPGNYPVNPQVTNPLGVRLFDDIAGATTVISFQDMAIGLGLGLNDGNAINTGNLNTILAASADNIVKVNLISRPDDTVLNGPAGAVSVADMKDGRVFLTIWIRSGFARVTDYQGNDTGWVVHAGVTFGGFDAVGGEPAPATVAENRHIILTGWSGQIPFTPTVGTEVQWFLPHDHLDPAGPNDRKISRYGWEFSLDVDTSTPGFSDSAYIDSDRLTFHEVIDFTGARPRGFEHDNGVGATHVYQTQLRVKQVWLGLGAYSTANDVAAGPLEFVSREGSLTNLEGTWNPAPSPAEEGSLRVMAFEFLNTPITGSNITAALVASQSLDTDGVPILVGNGIAEGNQIHTVVPVALSGDVGRVVKGDLVYIDRSGSALPSSATEKAGTYIVRYAVEPTVGPNLYKPVAGATLKSGGGFITSLFPRVVSFDFDPFVLRLELDSTTILPASGKVYVQLGDLNTTVAAEYKAALFSVEYTAKDVSGLSLVGGSFKWADDSAVVDPVVDLVADLVGLQIGWHDNSGGGTGIQQIPIQIRGNSLPDDSSVVGYNAGAAYGVNTLTFSRYGSVALTFGALEIVRGLAPAAGEAAVAKSPVYGSEVFDPTGEEIVYEDVPYLLSLNLDNIQATTLNDPNTLSGGAGVACLLPGSLAVTDFWAKGGVFVEPSTPRVTLNLDPASDPKVVDASRSLTAGTIGMRNPTAAEDVHFEVRRCRRWHGQQNGVNDAFHPLQYAYEIRRGVVTDFSRNEQQVGTLTALNFEMNWNVGTPFPRVPDVWSDNDGVLYQGTNLGPFTSEDVNIHPGDILRLLDDAGVVLEEAVVSEVVSDAVLKLRAPGFATLTQASVIGRRFEVWLRQAPVPHEQSNEQLLDLITDQVIHETVADQSDVDPSNWVGGYVPEVAAPGDWTSIANLLYDDSASPPDFVALGVRAGDIVIIDPMGLIPVVDERGSRPFGDTSVPGRTAGVNPSPHVVGQVSSLDDNRGFYRVQSVEATNLTLDPVHSFAGTLGADVLMATTQTDLMYAIYPTVGLSELSDPAPNTGEGQNDLRPTRKATEISPGVWSYTDSLDTVLDKHSLRPFSYRIIRPNAMFSAEIVDAVLMMRERMLSLIEMFRSVMKGTKGGYYWDWQDQEHVLDLGAPFDPDSGSGLFPNRLVTTLVGEADYSPFINTSDCLSLLDRRFWILDRRLDTLKPDATNPFGMTEFTALDPSFPDVGGPYTAYTDQVTGGSEVRPVLPDELGLILDVRDRLRAIRYTWLAYRTHRYIGTLARVQAFDEALPARLEDRQRTLLLEQTAEGVTG